MYCTRIGEADLDGLVQHLHRPVGVLLLLVCLLAAGDGEKAGAMVRGSTQVLAVRGHGGEVGGQFLPDRQGLAIFGLRLPPPPEFLEQDPQVEVAPGQILAVRGDDGEVGDEFLLDRQGLAILGLRLPPLPEIIKQVPQVELA